MTDVRQTFILEAQSVGIEQAVENVKKLALANQGLAVASDQVAKATPALERQLATLQRGVDPAAASMEKMARGFKVAGDAMRAGLVDQARFNNLIDQTRLAYDAAAQAAKRKGEAEAEMIRQARAASVGEGINQRLGVGRTAAPTGANNFPGLAGLVEREAMMEAARAANFQNVVNRQTGVDRASPYRSGADFTGLAELVRQQDEAARSAEELRVAQERAAESTRKMVEEARALAQAESAQLDVNQRLGVGRRSSYSSGADFPGLSSLAQSEIEASENALRDQARAAKEAEQAATQYAISLERVRAMADPLYNVTKRYNEALREAETALKRGDITGGQFADIQRRLQVELGKSSAFIENNGKVAATAGLNWVNMGYQINDVISGLAMGQSPFMILTQQGGQVVQILQQSQGGIIGGLKEMGGALASLITPARVGMTAIALGAGTAAVALYQASTASEQLRKALTGIGQGSGGSAGQLREIANQGAAAAEISIGAARETAIALTRTGKIGVEQFSKLIAVQKDYAVATAQDLGEAGKDLASIFADPGRGIDTLGDKLGGLDAKTRNYIQTLAASGRTTEAQNAAMEFLARRTENAAKTLGPLTRGWEAFWRTMRDGATGFGQDIERGIEKLSGGTNQDALKRAMAVRQGAGVSASPETAAQMDAVIKGLQDQIDAEQKLLALRRQADQGASRSRAVDELLKQTQPVFQQFQQLTAQAELLYSVLSNPIALSGLEPEKIEAIRAQFVLTREALMAMGQEADLAGLANRRLQESFALQVEQMYALLPVEQALTAERIKRQELELSNDPTKNLQIQQAYQSVLEQSLATEVRASREQQFSISIQNELSSAIERGAMTAQRAGQIQESRVRAARALQQALLLEERAAQLSAQGNMEAARSATEMATRFRDAARGVEELGQASAEAASRRATSGMIEQMEAELRLAKAEYESLGMNAQAREIYLAGLRAQEAALAANNGLMDENVARLRATAEELERVRQRTEQLTAAQQRGSQTRQTYAQYDWMQDQEYANYLNTRGDDSNQETFTSSAVPSWLVNYANKTFGEGGFDWASFDGQSGYMPRANQQGQQFQRMQQFSAANGGMSPQQVLQASNLDELERSITAAISDLQTTASQTSTSTGPTASTTDPRYFAPGKVNPYAENVASIFYNAADENKPFLEHQISIDQSSTATAANTAATAAAAQEQIARLQAILDQARASAAAQMSPISIANAMTSALQAGGFGQIATQAAQAPSLTSYYDTQAGWGGGGGGGGAALPRTAGGGMGISTIMGMMNGGIRLGGFADGGSFIVPGSGSTDQPFQIGLTPGERVTVTPKGEAGGEGSKIINISVPISVMMPSDDPKPFLESAGMIASRVRSAMQSSGL